LKRTDSQIDEEESIAMFNMLIEKTEAAGFIHMRSQIRKNQDTFQNITPITGSRSTTLALVLPHTL